MYVFVGNIRTVRVYNTLHVRLYMYTVHLHVHYLYLSPSSQHTHTMFAEYLNQNADMFQRTATRLRRKLWWQNVKLWIILIVILLVILAVIISESLVHVHVATVEPRLSGHLGSRGWAG